MRQSYKFRLFAITWIIALLCALFIVGCNAPTQRTYTSAPPTASPTATQNPPILDRTSGKEVLYLSSKSTQNGGKSAHGTFFSSGPYHIGAICTGDGTLTVQTTSLTFSINCTHSGNMQVEQFGSADNPPTPQTNQVQVTASGTSVWEVSIQILHG